MSFGRTTTLSPFIIDKVLIIHVDVVDVCFSFARVSITFGA